MPVALYVKNRAAFEFSKRKFVRKYGPDLPVWALLVSGSTGGVRLSFHSVYHRLYSMCCHRSPTGSLLILWVSQLRFFLLPNSNFSPPVLEDVVKSRVQLRTTPPSGTPVQYIAGELRAVVAESGV